MEQKEKQNQIQIGQILYNIGYWLSLAQDYYSQMNEVFKNQQTHADGDDSTNSCD